MYRQTTRGNCTHKTALLLAIMVLQPSLIARADSIGESAQDKGSAQANQTEARKLEVGKPIEREVAGGEVHSYEIALTAGQYFNAIVDQRGIDVKVAVIAPDGEQTFEFDGEKRKEGQETVTVVAEVTGNYRLDVQPVDKKAVGSYEVTVAELRAATEQDRQLQQARKLYDESVRLWRKGQYDAAFPLGEQALSIREKVVPDHAFVAQSLHHLANFYYTRGDYAKAEPMYQRALTIWEKSLGPDHPDVARPLNNLANLYSTKGDYTKAETFYQHALAIREKALGPDHPVVAESLNNLAILYVEKGDYGKAEPLYQRTMTIWEKSLGLDHPLVATSVHNLAILYKEKGDYARAETLYRRALAIREKTLGPDHPDVASSLNSLATLYKERGDYEKAEPLHQRAIAIREKSLGPGHPDVAIVLNNLANLYIEKGDYTKAEPLYQRAIAIREKALGPDHPGIAEPLMNLATLYKQKADYAKAEPLYQRALAIKEKSLGPDHPLVAHVLNNLGILYIIEKGDYAKAEPLYQRALAIWEKSLGPDHHYVALSLNNLANLYSDRGEHAKAVEYLSRAVKISERNISLNIATGSERQKLLYLATLAAQTNDVISLHSPSESVNASARSLAVATILQRKGRTLESMTDIVGSLRRRANPQDRELIDQLTDARARLAKLVLGGPAESKVVEYRVEIKKLEERIEELEASISRHSAEFRTQSQAVTLETLQAAIPNKAALVEFASYRQRNPNARKGVEQYGEARYVAYVIRNQGEPALVELGDATEINDKIGALRKALRDPERKDVKRLARAVDHRVMEPVRNLLGKTQEVLLSPERDLNLIPFAALVDEQNRYLVERYSFGYLTSGRDLLRLQQKFESKQGAMVLADPDFAGDTTPCLDRKLKLSKGAVDFSQVLFCPLPATASEAEALRALIPHATVLTKKQATEAAVKQAAGPKLLHIATHGYFLEDVMINLGTAASDAQSRTAMKLENPLLRSGIALAGANIHKSGDDDGVLTALEAAGLDLWGTKLVVLSACDTGLGEVKNGDGVYGLRRALVLAGSESQVMSLWPVSDTATRDLMIGYYKGLQAGQGRGEALRQVQLRMLASKKRQHPYFWASFIQSGEWANMDGKR